MSFAYALFLLVTNLYIHLILIFYSEKFEEKPLYVKAWQLTFIKYDRKSIDLDFHKHFIMLRV